MDVRISVRWLRRVAVFVLVAAGIVPPVLASQSVILSDESPPMEIGQGFLTRYADQCHLIMPTHVAGQGGVNFLREGRQPVFGVLRDGHDLDDDISLFEVNGVRGHLCGESLSVLPRAVDTALQGEGTAHVRFVNGDGSTGAMAVAIVDNDLSTYLRIKPLVDGERISRGMSGSLLLARGTVVGMLLSVNARSGVGTVMRQDAMIHKVETFFRQGTRPAVGVDPVAEGPLASLKLVAWDALPVGAIQPDAVATEGGAGPWRSAYSGKPLTLDFALQTPGRTWSGVRIDVRGIPEPERPDIVELLMAPGLNPSSWISVKTSRLDYVDDVALVTVAQRKGALLRLRLSRQVGDQTGGGQHLGVRRFEALP
ncbi:MAG: hypothetical protein WCX93_12540 [Burkholderiaceae bacterium]